MEEWLWVTLTAAYVFFGSYFNTILTVDSTARPLSFYAKLLLFQTVWALLWPIIFVVGTVINLGSRLFE